MITKTAHGVITENWNDIHFDIVRRFNLFNDIMNDIDLSNKTKSEIMSAVVETAFLSVLKRKDCDVRTPKLDSEPDAYVMGEAVEIKTTSGDQWRGGSFSKRPGLYILASWSYNPQEETQLFAALQNMSEGDWKSSMLDSQNNVIQGSNYYATVYGKKALVEQNKYTLLSGDIEHKTLTKTGKLMKKPSIKIIRNKMPNSC